MRLVCRTQRGYERLEEPSGHMPATAECSSDDHHRAEAVDQAL